MTCRFRILIHFIKLDIKEGHKLEIEEEEDKVEEDITDHMKRLQDKKHGEMIIFLKTLERILMLAKHTIEDNLFDDYGKSPNVGQEYYGSYYGGQQGGRALNKIKWKVHSFKGKSYPNVFLDWERQVENLFMVRNYSDNIKAKLIIAEFSGYPLHWDIANQLELDPYTTYEDMCHLATKTKNQRKRIGFSKTNLHFSRNVVPKPQASTYKSWPKKDKTAKVSSKDNPKSKVKEKGRLITSPTRCFKCNGVEHIDINFPIKRTLVFCEVLNCWIKKDEHDCQQDIVEKE
ncbi:hypothetical protein M9H77_07431 [Catharanthus roseus]|uniref:Uncharacterized protein n=1 Tax=Catharanthus roseus TaxID=4058 RepID=A0ACC0BV65_CATRO|nr:hypothetical protein M9H77_07431 [Catharanthus roseus]